ncbi:MAG: radical SAM protein [Planctomycetes bacterium]|nr:radical SAM protein [Planctomycetota bacterium]
MAGRKNPKVCLIPLGCPKNLVDGEKMLGMLAQAGCVVGAPAERADVIIVNTCAFLSAARDESLKTIRQALRLKRCGRVRRVVVSGCLPARDGQRLAEELPEVDAIVDISGRDQIAKAVLAGNFHNRSGHAGFFMQSSGGAVNDSGRFRLTPRHTAYLRIAYGCSRRCTFCTIPSIRGPYRSKPSRDILDEARELIGDGAIELNLIAQDTTSYGLDAKGHSFVARASLPLDVVKNNNRHDRDGRGTHGQDARATFSTSHLKNSSGLAGLLKKLDKLNGLRWIRLMYAYPTGFSDELIDVMAGCRRVVPYVDIPLQHINDKVLRLMGRRVTRKQIEGLLVKLRKKIPAMSIRTTFIVGFPGETAGQFAELLRFAGDFRFDALGVFEYSPEAGTPAARLSGRIHARVKSERARRLMLQQQKIVMQANAAKIGRTIEVLVDGVDRSGRCVGRHAGQAPDVDSICIFTSRREPGQIIPARVIGFSGYDLIVE